MQNAGVGRLRAVLRLGENESALDNGLREQRELLRIPFRMRRIDFFGGGDIARANTAVSMIYIVGGLVGRPLTGAAMDAFGDPGLGRTLAVFYVAACIAAIFAWRRTPA